MPSLDMTTEQLREANQCQANRVPGADLITVLDVDKPIVFRMRDSMDGRYTLLCQEERGVIYYRMWNSSQVSLSLSYLTGLVGQQPVIAHRGWQRHVADWLATSRQLIEDVDFDG